MSVVALAGGVGGAKLAEGLQAVLGAELTVIVNTADDTERHGLLVCADHDTVMYTLAGIENPEFGWASPATPGRRCTPSSGTARRAGSGSVTRTSPPTSSGPSASVAASA